ncbi:MAG TPA: DUF5335 family protein [Thermoleophilaceae bacterium]|nr:DUF5335 family protein [Thermoleophilaceae bacterium]
MGVEAAARTGKELSQDEWAAYFEQLDKRIEAGTLLEATIEVVADPTVGTEAEKLPLNSITYEDGDDQIAIGVGGRGERYPSVLWHFVDRPRRVIVNEDDERIGIAIESEDETLTVLRLYKTG